MGRKAADLSQFQVKSSSGAPVQDSQPRGSKQRSGKKQKRKYKTFRVTPEAARQFDILRAETQIPGPDLIAEALNLLFERYGKPPLA